MFKIKNIQTELNRRKQISETLTKYWNDPKKFINRMCFLEPEKYRQICRDVRIRDYKERPEIKDKISQTVTQSYNEGRIVSPSLRPEVAKKIGEATSRVTKEKIKNGVYVNNFEGKKHTKESIDKIKKARVNQYFPKSSSLERLIKNELEKRSLGGLFKHNINVCDICQPDHVCVEYKIVIFDDGDFWHANPDSFDYNKLSPVQIRNIERDWYIDEQLKNRDYSILRFYESDIKKNLSNCVDLIERELMLRGCLLPN